MNHKFKFTCIASALCMITNAQTVPYWKLGGNPNPPVADGVNTTNNYLGTNALNSTFLRIGVQGSQDIFIDNDNSKLYPNSTQGNLPQGGHWVGLGRIFKPTNGPGSNPAYAPKAHLHIHGRNNSIYSGFSGFTRPWFDTGVLLTEESDGMYVGLKNVGSNQSNAIINWSDDTGASATTDFLQFNFTGYGPDLDGTVDGAELARMSPEKGKGTLGVGNFQFIGASTQPVRRLEILDADPQTGANTNTPQLRTTYTYNATPTSGIFTEFQTTSLGDMYFNTRANGNARRFGFHDNTPGNTVEITANGSSPIPINANGTSGLRFTDMVAGNTPQPNPGTGVLSVNATGDVILVPGGGISNADNGVSLNASVVQLGVPCTLPGGFPNLTGILATQLTTDRVIANRNQNLWIASLNTDSGGVGIGGQPVLPFCGTGNTFEVSANSKNTKYGSIAASGVRFTKLLSTSPTVPNGTYGVNSAKVLTVDDEGDVVLTDAATTVNGNNGIFVNAAGTAQLGTPCSATFNTKFANGLTTDRVIHMRGNNFIFGDGGRVGIGLTMAGPNMSCGVGNKLEIINTIGNPYFVPGGAGSGLRFRYLTSASAVTPNGTNGVNTSKVLTVDVNGDVVLTDGGGCKTTLVATSAAPSANCSTGGVMLQYGVDANCNGVLDPSEVNAALTQYVCNGSQGIPGPTGPAGGIVNASNGVSLLNPSTVELGNAVGGTSGRLLNHREIPLNGYNLHLNMSSGGNFIVGPSTNVIGGWGNSVFGGNNTLGTMGDNHIVGLNNTINNTGIKLLGNSNTATGNGDIILGNGNKSNINMPGVSGNLIMGTINEVDGTSNTLIGYSNKAIVAPMYNSNPINSLTFGNYNYAYGGDIVIGNKVVGTPGGDFVSIGNHNGNPTSAINAYFNANTGVPFTAIVNAHLDPTLSSNDYIPAINISSTNRVGIKKYYAGVALDVAGTIASPSALQVSDSTLKTNIQTLNINAVQKLKQFRPITYEWINKIDTGMYGTQYGFTAQQIETVMPDLVKTGIDGIKTLNQLAMIPLLVKAIKEQQATIDSLKQTADSLTTKTSKQDSINNAVQQQLANLAALIDGCCHTSSTRQSNSSINQLDIELSDKDAIVLNQNVPNPFAEQTTITYNVPASVGKAQLIFFNTNGQVIQTVDIKTRGKGKVNVFASDLSSGLYNYSLVADGKVIDSKKMVRE